MTIIYPGRDVLGPREFADNARGISFRLRLTEPWTTVRFQLLRAMEDHFEGLFDVTVVPVGQEDAEFTVHVEDHEVNKAEMLVAYLTK